MTNHHEEMPYNLRQRLEEAGVTDEATLERALAADDDLRRDVEAFAVEQHQQMFGQFLATLPAELRARLDSLGVVDEEGLEQVVAQHPEIGEQITELAAQMRSDVFHQLFDELVGIMDGEALLALVERAPFVLTDEFFGYLDQAITQAEQSEAHGADLFALGLRQRLAALEQIRAQIEEDEGNAPPFLDALRAFVLAEDDLEAEIIFSANRGLLHDDEAADALETQMWSDDAGLQQRIIARRALLRRLRGSS